MNTRSQSKAANSLNNKTTQSSSSSSAIAPSFTVESENDIRDSRKIAVVSWLQLILDPVLKRSTIGDESLHLKDRVMLDDEVFSSAPPHLLERTGNKLGDQIRLLIPYADTTLNWNFSFCWLDPTLPPDMEFGEHHFMPAYETYEEYFDWNPSSPDCFVNLVRRLFFDYRAHHLSVCETHARLQAEISELRARGCLDHHFDVLAYQAGARRGDVVFVFPIPVPAISKLPGNMRDKETAETCPRLKIKFTSFGDDKAHADLEMTPFLNKLFNGKSLKLPPMQCFVQEYVEEVRNILDEEVTMIADSYQFKGDLIKALISAFPKGSLMDYCDKEVTIISFLLDHQDFNYTLKITLGSKFPQGPNSVNLTFSSVYHESKESRFSSKKPRQLVCHTVNMPSFATSIRQRPSVDEVVEKIRGCIDANAPDFKRKSCSQGV